MTADEVIGNLIVQNVIPPQESGYALQIKGSKQLNGNESLVAVGVKEDVVLIVSPYASWQ